MLQELDIDFGVQVVAVDETPRASEGADTYLERVVAMKLDAVRAHLDAEGISYSGIVVADTAVILGDRILGKPRDDDQSYEMLQSLQGRAHQVKSRYAAFHKPTGEQVARTVSTDVFMRPAHESELRAYVATGEGKDKAGSYAIQGRGAFLVQSIRGSYSNVVGLPLCELILDLTSLGLLERFP